MPINFSALPTSNPFALPDAGCYKAKIVEAQMRAPKNDATKPDYLNLKYELFNNKGEKCGSIYDILSESDSQVVQYKIGRFIQACGLPLTGAMELKDLAKIVLNRVIVVDIMHDKKSDTPRAVVDVFSRGAYYPEAEFEDAWKNANPNSEVPPEADFVDQMGENTPFNAPDGQALTGTSEY